MTHTHVKGHGQRSLGSKVRVEAVGQTDGADCITFRANMVRTKCFCIHSAVTVLDRN